MKKLLEKILMLFVFCLPLGTVFIFDEKLIGGLKWQYGTGQLYLSELILIIFILLAGWHLMKTKVLIPTKISWRNWLTKPSSRLTLSVWLFLGWAGLSILWSIEKSSGYYLWLKILEGGALFFLLLNLKFDLKVILWPLVASASLQSLVAIWQFISQTIAADKLFGIAYHSAGQLGDIVIETGSGRWLRAYGTFAHPNILGGFLILGLIAALILYQKSKLRLQPLLIGLISLITAGLFFSFSRSAVLALALIFILTAVEIIRKSKTDWNYLKILKPLTASVMMLIALSFIYWPLLANRSNLTNRLENKSIQERLTQTNQALKIIGHHPLTGIGFNNYTAYLWRQNPAEPIYSFQPVHNLCLLIASELGLIGLILFLFLLISTILYARNNHANLIIYSPLILIITVSCLDHYLLTQFAGLMIFWLSLFLIAGNRVDLSAEKC